MNGGNNLLYYKKDVICPCCFEHFPAEDVLYADQKDLCKRDYQNLVQAHQQLFHESVSMESYPLIFRKGDDGMDIFSARTSSGDITHQRVCPKCFSYLPAAAGHYPALVIPIMGSSKPLKSAYIAQMLHNFNKCLSKWFNASLIPADFETAQRFYQQYETDLFLNNAVPDPEDSVKPLLYKFSRNNVEEAETVINAKTNERITNQALLMFYDVNMSSYNELPEFYRGVLRNADGLLLMLDSSEALYDEESAGMTDSWLGFLTEELTYISEDRFKMPTAVVITELDRLSGRKPKRWQKLSSFAASVDHIEKSYPAAEFGKISFKMTKLLKDDYPVAMNVITSMFSIMKTRLFGYNSCMDNGVVMPEKIRAIPTEIPLLYLMTQLKLFAPGSGRIVKSGSNGFFQIKKQKN